MAITTAVEVSYPAPTTSVLLDQIEVHGGQVLAAHASTAEVSCSIELTLHTQGAGGVTVAGTMAVAGELGCVPL